MAQPHKGDRRLLMVRIDMAVHDRLAALVATGRATSVSQAAADLLAIATQLPDRAREFPEPPPGLWDTEEMLPLKTA